MNPQKKGAFTLVELIVVITILAILWTIAFLSFQWYSRDARDTVRTSDLSNLTTSLQLFETTTWIYPEPTWWIDIIYQSWKVWSQWTLWDSVVTNLQQLNKKPVDPLTNNEYTYSRLNTKKEYELWAILEWDLASLPNILSQTYANENYTALVKWNYNWIITTFSTWWTAYVIALPSIVATDLSDTALETILSASKLVFTWETNIPESYQDWTTTSTGWFVFNAVSPDNIILFTWSLKELSESWTLIQSFTQNLQSAYSGSSLSLEWVYAEISNIDLTDSWAILTLASSIVNENTWVDIENDIVISDVESITWWRLIDSNCKVDDLIIWSQIWAWCNSTLWDGFDFVNNHNESCHDYDNNFSWISWCDTSSSTSEKLYFDIVQPDGVTNNSDTWFDNIWWKLYIWNNASTACISWRKVPSDEDWYNLEVELGSTDRSTNGNYSWIRDWWYSGGLWWFWHSSKNNTNSLVQALKIPLAWYLYTDNYYYERWLAAIYWTSTDSWWNAYRRYVRWVWTSVNRDLRSKSSWYSVRCLKNL